jgi:hypothetical protein
MARSTWIHPVPFSGQDVFVDVALPTTGGTSPSG